MKKSKKAAYEAEAKWGAFSQRAEDREQLIKATALLQGTDPADVRASMLTHIEENEHDSLGALVGFLAENFMGLDLSAGAGISFEEAMRYA